MNIQWESDKTWARNCGTPTGGWRLLKDWYCNVPKYNFKTVLTIDKHTSITVHGNCSTGGIRLFIQSGDNKTNIHVYRAFDSGLAAISLNQINSYIKLLTLLVIKEFGADTNRQEQYDGY